MGDDVGSDEMSRGDNLGSRFTRAERQTLLAMWPNWPGARRAAAAEMLALHASEVPVYTHPRRCRFECDPKRVYTAREQAARSASDPTGIDALADLAEASSPAASHPLTCGCKACVEGDPFAEAERWHGWDD